MTFPAVVVPVRLSPPALRSCLPGDRAGRREESSKQPRSSGVCSDVGTTLDKKGVDEKRVNTREARAASRAVAARWAEFSRFFAQPRRAQSAAAFAARIRRKQNKMLSERCA